MNLMSASVAVTDPATGTGRLAIVLIPADSAGIQRAPFWQTTALPAIFFPWLLELDPVRDRAGRSVSEGGRYSSASAGSRSDQESRSATVRPGLAFGWKAGMIPSP